jgi:hypothetical protein
MDHAPARSTAARGARDTALERYVGEPTTKPSFPNYLLFAVEARTPPILGDLVGVPGPGGRGTEQGLLLAFAEDRILRDSPNVFICVSSFNSRARALYERLGYVTVGELRDFFVRGYDEQLLRKTIGPLTEFTRRD